MQLGERVHAELRAALSPLTSRIGPADQRRLETLLARMLQSPEG